MLRSCQATGDTSGMFTSAEKGVNSMNLVIRSETAKDVDSIRSVNDLAFEQDAEGKLVDELRGGDFVVLSMVAELDGKVIAHILYSKLLITKNGQSTDALALAPMAVTPRYQRLGIGSQLIRASLDLCREQGHKIVIVLGHPNYYPRFGFSARLARRLQSPYAGDSFMALELVEGSLRGVTGQVKYAAPFEAH